MVAFSLVQALLIPHSLSWYSVFVCLCVCVCVHMGPHTIKEHLCQNFHFLNFNLLIQFYIILSLFESCSTLGKTLQHTTAMTYNCWETLVQIFSTKYLCHLCMDKPPMHLFLNAKKKKGRKKKHIYFIISFICSNFFLYIDLLCTNNEPNSRVQGNTTEQCHGSASLTFSRQPNPSGYLHHVSRQRSIPLL
jgi:hypothetical protein